MKTREEQNKYMREYLKRRHHERRAKAVEKLGGKCARCGSAENLEFDHIDRTKKSISIERMWLVSQERHDAELAKCQLLCDSCHTIKSIYDIGKKPARGTHGTISAYRYCKCDLCREANRKTSREYMRRRRNIVAV